MTSIKPSIFAIIIFAFCFFLSCKKDEIHVLRKGEWNMKWYMNCTTSTGPAPCYSGKVNFKSGGKGIFYPSGSSDKVPFLYTVSGSTATFQFYNPNVYNTIYNFNIVIEQDTLQVWEAGPPPFSGNTIELRK